MATQKTIKIETKDIKEALDTKNIEKVEELLTEVVLKHYKSDAWVTCNLWEKYDKSRVYVNIYELRGFNNNKSKLMDTGMIDLQKEIYELKGNFNFKNSILAEIL